MDDFKNRLIKMNRHFGKWARRRDIHVYRIYDKDLPAYPFAVDRYEDKLCISEYHNEKIASRDDYPQWREQILTIVSQALEITPENIFYRTRKKQSRTSQYEKRAHEIDFFEVTEGGLKFLVNLTNYLDTGLFPDHRNTRAMVRNEAKDKRFLNLFCYTGSFSVYAAAGGARNITSVDTSQTYLHWFEKNLELNGFESIPHENICRDAREFLARYRGEPFDLIVCDPPVFSRGKKLKTDFDVQKDHPTLIDACMKLLAPGGILYFSTNLKKFKMEWPGEAGQITPASIPDDYSNKRIHTCFRITKPTHPSR